MERHRCRLCRRRFSNGRALGGHMRSHVVAPAPSPLPLPSPSASSSSFPVAPGDRPPAAAYSLRENPRKSFRLVDPEFSSSVAVAESAAGGSSSVVQDGESDAESSFRRRLCRPRRLEDHFADAKPVSSVSDASTEEDVARCLMLLSRDAWSRSKAQGHQSNGWDRANEGEGEDAYYDEEEEEVEEKELPLAARSRQKRTRYQCSTCGKYFRSYQALGGHCASHKRVGTECIPTTDANAIAADRIPKKRFECPYCSRVFPSGQALGGHKRSHLSSATYSAAAAAAAPAPRLPPPQHSPLPVNKGFIDLNLPASLEEEAELSALSVTSEFASK